MHKIIALGNALALGAAAAAAMIVAPAAAADRYVDPFTLANRAAAKATDRYGDVPLGAVIRTDERYNRGGLFQGPRGWDYWNYLPDPSPIRTRTFGRTSGRPISSANW